MIEPGLPFEPLTFEGVTYTFSNFKNLVMFTDNKDVITNFNQFFGNVNRCTLSETPCGGLKDVRFPDMCPGTISIESGHDCYLASGGHVGKVLSAGQLSESGGIITSDSAGISYCLANGDEYLFEDGDSYLVTPPNNIVCKFKLFNASAESRLCKLRIRSPDSVNSVKLYNLDSDSYEDVVFYNVVQTVGTVKSYGLDRTIAPHTEENLQIMIEYTDLGWSYSFDSSEHPATGLWNLKTFLAFYDPATKDVYFLLFTEVPTGLTCTVSSSGEVTELTIPKTGNTVYIGKEKYAKISETVDGVPTCFIPSERGSLASLLQRYFAIVDIQSNIDLKTYVVDPISDDKILPATQLPSNKLSNSITCQVCPGEHRAESFVMRSNKDVTLTIGVSDLICDSYIIPASAIITRYVDCWYQAGCDSKNTHKAGKFLTPELLTYDPELVRTNCDEWETWNLSNPYAINELKLQDGSYIDITTPTHATTEYYQPTIAERPVYDADILQPVFLKKDLNRQVWLTISPPAGSVPGTYTSTIFIKAGKTVLKTINVSVEVLSFELVDNENDAIYYRGKIQETDIGTISSESKSQAQFLADHENMYRHGIRNPVLMTHTETTLPIALSIRTQCGISNDILLYYATLNIDDLIADIQAWKDICTALGVAQLFIYGHDEADMSSLTSKMTDIHNIGVKIFCAQSPTYALAVKDYLDIAIGNSGFTAEQIAQFRAGAVSGDVYSYGNPQTAVEYPLTFRRNYGLYLWQLGYFAACPYAYQHSFWDIWNDFDDDYAGQDMYRDHAFTYPTADTPVDTVQWEGFAAGVTDRRYLATLQATLGIAETAGIDVTAITAWVNALQVTDLTTLNLDDVRSQIITYIKQLNYLLQLIRG